MNAIPRLGLVAVVLVQCCTASAQTLVGGVEVPAFKQRVEPASSEMSQAIGGGFKFSASGDGVLVQRYVFDTLHRIYSGYDVLVEPSPASDACVLTFRQLSINIDEFAERLANLPLQRGNNPREWNFQAPASPPLSQSARQGETIAVDLIAIAGGGQEVVDYITIMQGPRAALRTGELQALARSLAAPSNSARPSPPAPSSPPKASPSIPTPTMPGEARVFSAEDAEMRVVRPRVLANGAVVEDPTGAAGQASTGSLVWFYLPSRGRYVLSLVPRDDLGFTKAGEVRGGSASFTSESDTIIIECPIDIAPGHAPYYLYVLHDLDFSPASAAQKSRLVYGSVSPEELRRLGPDVK
jgi:hypothetical protein